jgi:hypothetical protein
MLYIEEALIARMDVERRLRRILVEEGANFPALVVRLGARSVLYILFRDEMILENRGI